MRIPFDRFRHPEFADHDLTLVIPAYNEESRLPKTLSDAKSQLDSWGINYRVLVVDDGSRDEDFLRFARKMAAKGLPFVMECWQRPVESLPLPMRIFPTI